jgi:hypothetical protein
MAYQWSTTHTYSLTPYVGRGLHIQVSIRLYGKGKGGEALNTVLGELPAFAAAAATAVLVVCGAVCEANNTLGDPGKRCRRVHPNTSKCFTEQDVEGMLGLGCV